MRKKTKTICFDKFTDTLNQYLSNQAPVWGERLSHSYRDYILAQSELSQILRNSWERRRARFSIQKKNIESLLYAFRKVLS